MATLTGQQIDASYLGLLKTEDNGVIGGVAKGITDGQGGVTNMTIGTTSTNFVSGTVDFTGSTVSGLPAGATGLENGTGADSLQSAASLTTTAADAKGAKGIALGDNALVFAANSICIGTSVNDADAARVKAISIGNNLGTAQRTVNIGNSQNAYGADGVCIGGSNVFGGNYNVSIGYNNNTAGGGGAEVVAIGANSTASANGSVALGLSVTAAKVNTVAVTELETKLAGGGITMVSPNGTEYKLTVSDAGALVIT